MSPKTWWT